LLFRDDRSNVTVRGCPYGGFVNAVAYPMERERMAHDTVARPSFLQDASLQNSSAQDSFTHETFALQRPVPQPLRGSEIFVVDDDESIRDALSSLLTPEGCRVTCFADGVSFLAAARTRTPACVLLDINLPGRSGLDMLRELDAPHYPAPILIVSGQRDVATAVNAIKCGALDFIEKPFDAAAVITRVQDAVAGWARRARKSGGDMPFPGYELLTPREREVLKQIIGGSSNKETGRSLGISPRTIEVHRARIMAKLEAKNAADLVRIVLSQDRGH
jgi:two-component system response regulator FixJ